MKRVYERISGSKIKIGGPSSNKSGIIVGPVTNIPYTEAPASGGGDLPQFGSLTHYWKLGEAGGNDRVNSIGAYSTFVEVSPPVASSAGKNGNGVGPTTSIEDLTCPDVSLGSGSVNTFTFWVNMSSFPATKCGVFRYANFDHPLIEIFADGTIRFTRNVGPLVISVPLGSTGTWHFVALVCSGSTWSVSIDGGTFTSAAGFALSSTVLGVEIVFVTTNPFSGVLDELAIWNAALTQGEVTAMWNGGTGVFLP